MNDRQLESASLSPEQAIDNFEDAWQQRNHQAIAAMLCNRLLSSELLAELIMIDMEYRWRSPLQELELHEAIVPNCPRVEDYLRLASTLQTEPDRIVELLGEEYRARLRWGEPTMRSEYFDRFPECQATFRSVANCIEQETPHACVSLIRSEIAIFSTRIYRKLSIGRQTIDEPPPICLIAVDQTLKLVVAPLRQVQVSRQQLEIHFFNPVVEVKNSSENVALKFSSGLHLPPGTSLQPSLPTSIQIGDYCLQIGRPGKSL